MRPLSQNSIGFMFFRRAMQRQPTLETPRLEQRWFDRFLKTGSKQLCQGAAHTAATHTLQGVDGRMDDVGHVAPDCAPLVLGERVVGLGVCEE